MAVDKGMGSCMIPRESDGLPCGMQIAEGEPIGTIMSNGPKVGHRACADAFKFRQKKEDAVKIGKQDGPGGSVGDPKSYPDALAFGSYDLEKKDPTDAPDVSEAITGAQGPVPEGTKSVADLPFDDPIDTWTDGRPQVPGPPAGALTELDDLPQIPTREDDAKKKLTADINNRFRYHQPTTEQANYYVQIRETARAFAHSLLTLCPDSRERSLALTHLDETVMWANASIARNG